MSKFYVSKVRRRWPSCSKASTVQVEKRRRDAPSRTSESGEGAEGGWLVVPARRSAGDHPGLVGGGWRLSGGAGPCGW